MITVGLTGGICCGKSTVSNTFRKHNLPVVDADIVARQVVEVDKPGWWMIKREFGEDHFNEDQTLNRTKLGNLVFCNQEAMNKLNEIMSSLISEESNRQINELHSQGHRIVIYDAALIVEMGNAYKYKPLVLVSCPREIQIERLMKRNNLSLEQANNRINAQMSGEAKAKFADYIIDTSTTIEESVRQTEEIINKLKSQEK